MHIVHIRGRSRRNNVDYEDALAAAARVIAQWDQVPMERIWGTYSLVGATVLGVEGTDFARSLVFVELRLSPRSVGHRAKLPQAVAEAVADILQLDLELVVVTIEEVPKGQSYWLGRAE